MAQSDHVILRAWQQGDIDAVASYANNRKIWINLRDRLPHPYTRANAEAWIVHCRAQIGPTTQFAIDLAGTAIGAIGFERFGDVHRLCAEIGYWVAEPFWGRGIATTATIQATEYGFGTLGLERIQAIVFEWNTASARVLEKAGYTLEGRLRRSIIKDGRLADSLLYSRIRA